MLNYTKAITSLLATLVIVLDTFFGINLGLDEGMLASIAAVVGTLLVYVLPNKVPPVV